MKIIKFTPDSYESKRKKNMADENSILRQCLNMAAKKKTWWEKHMEYLCSDFMSATLLFLVGITILAIIIHFFFNT